MAFRPYLIDEITRDCVAGALTRREAIRRLGLLGVTGAAAAAMVAAAPVRATASSGSTVPPTATGSGSTAPLEEAEEITFPGTEGDLIGVFAAAETPKGAVLVIHENRGLTPHIRSIPPRLAADGYSALAIDLLSEEGGTASMPSEGDAQAALGNAPTERLVADLRAGLDELERRVPGGRARGDRFLLRGRYDVAAPRRGRPAHLRRRSVLRAVPRRRRPLRVAERCRARHLRRAGRLRQPVDGSRRGGTQAAGLEHELRTFEGVDHAFFNDTGRNYDADAAAEAYTAMIDWFDSHLAGSSSDSTTEPAS